MAETKQEVRTFRVPEVIVKVGSKETAITINDLPWDKQKKLLEQISRILMAQQLLPEGVKNLGNAIQREMIVNKKSPEEATKIFLDKLAQMYGELNDEQVIDLLKSATNDRLTDEHIADMGATEMLNMLVWLINRQAAGLKNLYASLSTMLSPKTEKPQK